MEWLNYHHLLYFWTVVREGGVSKAAEKLRLAQPTVSAQVRMLEDYCDNSFIPPTTMLLAQLRKPEAERDQARVDQAKEEWRFLVRSVFGGR